MYKIEAWSHYIRTLLYFWREVHNPHARTYDLSLEMLINESTENKKIETRPSVRNNGVRGRLVQMVGAVVSPTDWHLSCWHSSGRLRKDAEFPISSMPLSFRVFQNAAGIPPRRRRLESSNWPSIFDTFLPFQLSNVPRMSPPLWFVPAEIFESFSENLSSVSWDVEWG